MTTGASGRGAAVQIEATGDPEVMNLVPRTDPAAGEDGMTVAVAAAGVNFTEAPPAQMIG